MRTFGAGTADPPEPATRLLAVLINYRTAAMTIESARALVPELRALPDARVVIVDNGSADGSFERLAAAARAEGWSDVATVVASERNRGFAGGINFALRPVLGTPSAPDYVYLLNSDAFVEPRALCALVEFMQAHPEVGICGSSIHGPEGEPHETAFRFPTVTGEFISRVPLWPFTPLLSRFTIALPIPTTPQAVDWLAGASMLIRREVFDAIGLFDEGFFLYYEETDFCLRARRAGFSTWYLPQSRVAHIGSESTGFKDATRPRAGYWFESRRRYLRKHGGNAYLLLANVMWVLSFGLGRLRRALKRLPDRDPPDLLKDFVRHNFGSLVAGDRGIAAATDRREGTGG
jgi:GT2 family glycosyltransferase